MKAIECFEKYEEIFGESMSFPFNMPSDKTLEDFINAIQECIERKEKFDSKKYGFDVEDNVII